MINLPQAWMNLLAAPEMAHHSRTDAPAVLGPVPFKYFTPAQAACVEAITEQIIPADQDPGAKWAGVVHYIDLSLAGEFAEFRPIYRAGLSRLGELTKAVSDRPFPDLDFAQQTRILEKLQSDAPGTQLSTSGQDFFALVRRQTIEGFFGDPKYGGNRDVCWLEGAEVRGLRGKRFSPQTAREVVRWVLATGDETTGNSFLSHKPRRTLHRGHTMKLAKIALLSAVLLIPGSILIPCSLLAQEQAIKDPLLRWMNHIAQGQLQARQKVIDQIHTVAEAEQRKQVVREKLLEILGGLPDYHGPLNAKITGEIKADGYTIEKVLFQSLPNFYVTGDLYRPNKPGRYPAILFQSGHTQEGKPEPQRAAANLALKGFVVFATDPIGQGEREQTYDPHLSGALAGWSVPEHIQAGAQSILVGRERARFFIWDAKRAIDYLVSRPDVDPARLGAAGCSGGGALTTFIGALDPRLKGGRSCLLSQFLPIALCRPGPRYGNVVSRVSGQRARCGGFCGSHRAHALADSRNPG